MSVARTVLCLLAAAAGGCVSQAQIRQAREAAIPTDQRSYAIGRFSIDCLPVKERCVQRFDSMSVGYSSSAGKSFEGVVEAVQGSFGYDTVFDEVSITAGEKSFYFCEVFPPGEHSFFTMRYWNFAGGGGGFFLRDEDYFSLPFSTAPGEVVYVGRLKMTTSIEHNIFGMPLHAPGQLLLSSDAHADIARALAKCPVEMRDARVRDAPLRTCTPNRYVAMQPSIEAECHAEVGQ